MRNHGRRAQYRSVLFEQYHSLAQERINNKKNSNVRRFTCVLPYSPSTELRRQASRWRIVTGHGHRVAGAALENGHPSSASGRHNFMAYFASALAVGHTYALPL